MDVTPGVLNDGGADTGPAIVIATRRPGAALAYLAQAPIGRYVVVDAAGQLPEGVELGGLAILDLEPLPGVLVEELTAAFLLSGT